MLKDSVGRKIWQSSKKLNIFLIGLVLKYYYCYSFRLKIKKSNIVTGYCYSETNKIISMWFFYVWSYPENHI